MPLSKYRVRATLGVLLIAGLACDTQRITDIIDAVVASISVSPRSHTLRVGDGLQLSANVVTTDNSPAPPVNWISANPTVAAVSPTGMVGALSAGSSQIRATSGDKSDSALIVVEPATVTVATVEITPPSASIYVGAGVQLSAVARDAGGAPLSGANMAWASLNTSIAQVTAAGLVTGLAVGSASIIAFTGGKADTASITVTQVPVASVAVTPPSATIGVGQTSQLQATVRDAGGNALTGRVVTWSTSSPSVATVSPAGLVSGVGAGSATITATSEGQSGTAAITVTAAPPPPPPPVATVTVAPASASVQVGQTTQLQAMLRDAGGNVLTGRSITWSTSSAGVATVSTSGLVTGVASGSATITASSEGKSGTSAITVTAAPPPAVATVTVSPSTATVQAGQTTQLQATLRDASGNVLTGRTITWSTSSAAVATVSSSGLVTGVATGSATITATSEGKSGTSAITVPAPPPAPVATVTVSPSSATVGTGQSTQLQATLRDASGNVLTGRVVTWSTSSVGIVTVSSSGLVTGVAAGSATITATSEGRNGTAAVTVTAPPPPPPPSSSGIWISRDELMTRPTSGAPWAALYADAASNHGTADISNQDSRHDALTLAASLVCVRRGEFCDKARAGVVSAIGTEQGGRWLAVGRNMLGYVIAADLLGLRGDSDPNSDGSRVERWIASFLTMKLAHNNTGEPMLIPPFVSGSNASAQQGAVYAAIGAYLKDQTVLQRAWDAYRTYACDPSAPDRETIDLATGTAGGWAHDDDKPCAINPIGTSKMIPAGRPGAGTVRRIDGAIINDMVRGGDYQWPPEYSAYPWVGLEGVVGAAVILHRAGYPAFEIANRAMLRTHEYLWYLREGTGNIDWFDGTRSAEVVFIINVVYGKSFPTASGVGAGRTFGYTDWSHMTWR